MSDGIPRLRMFAGPNGSGKTTVKNTLCKPKEWFGLYINPDDLEAAIRHTGFLSTEALGLTFELEDLRSHFAASTLLARAGLAGADNAIQWSGVDLDFRGLNFTSYHASVLADFLRRQALNAGASFSFETVMSAPDKVQLLNEAQQRGYRTYLYFVATESPTINIQRVRTRVAAGGHDVPQEKIVSRYHRSLELLKQAVDHTNRAFFFDTSGESAWYFAEIVDADRLNLQSEEVPFWFHSVWESIPESLGASRLRADRSVAVKPNQSHGWRWPEQTTLWTRPEVNDARRAP